MSAGIYIHIPFCNRKCFYCDFYSSANLGYKKDFLIALFTEITLQKNYLSNESISTIYIGGGTPSLLSIGEIKSILDHLKNNFTIIPNAEITIELNPDDITIPYAEGLIQTGINRVSVGIQSFFDDDLKLLNRRHNVQQATDSINFLKQIGFTNISADLIYGLPGMTLERWNENLTKMFQLNIQHISAYLLSVEAGTVFANFLEKGKITLQSDEQSFLQFKTLINETKQYGFVHYEISNFAKENYFSIHNSAYWHQKKYLGLGPSAHSYNINSRQWNVSDIKKYLEAINKNTIPCTVEVLTDTDKFNDYIMTSLRTKEGIELEFIKNNFGAEKFSFVLKAAEKFEKSGHLVITKNNIVLTDEGMFISDRIISDLFHEN